MQVWVTSLWDSLLSVAGMFPCPGEPCKHFPLKSLFLFLNTDLPPHLPPAGCSHYQTFNDFQCCIPWYPALALSSPGAHTCPHPTPLRPSWADLGGGVNPRHLHFKVTLVTSFFLPG